MGTRGFVGFVAGGQEEIAYNHAGSHPREVGLDVLSWLRNAATDPDGLHNAATALRVVTESDIPDAETLERLQSYSVTSLVERGNHNVWYGALRITQGRPELMLEAGYVLDASAFARSPQMRWGYLIDVDAWNFEVYQGGQRESHDRGRLIGLGPLPDEFGYYAAAMVASWSVFDLPTNADFLAKLGGA